MSEENGAVAVTKRRGNPNPYIRVDYGEADAWYVELDAFCREHHTEKAEVLRQLASAYLDDLGKSWATRQKALQAELRKRQIDELQAKLAALLAEEEAEVEPVEISGRGKK